VVRGPRTSIIHSPVNCFYSRRPPALLKGQAPSRVTECASGPLNQQQASSGRLQPPARSEASARRLGRSPIAYLPHATSIAFAPRRPHHQQLIITVRT